ncbi:MAG TPA: hypothetical protein PLD25_02470 [Chloroflexota bacterium]|nr:hypothetical protein [Chloroflexota bacterium]
MALFQVMAQNFPEWSVQNNGRLATDLLGFTAVDIIDNPDLVARRLDDLFGGIKAFVTAVTGDDAAALESARQQLRGLQEVLTRHGLIHNGQMDELADKIHAAYHQDQANRRQETAVGLEMLAQEVMGVATAVAQHLHAQAETYRQE